MSYDAKAMLPPLPKTNEEIAARLRELNARADQQPRSYKRLFDEAAAIAEDQFKRAMAAEGTLCTTMVMNLTEKNRGLMEKLDKMQAALKQRKPDCQACEPGENCRGFCK